MWASRVRQPSTNAIVISRRLAKANLRPALTLGRRYYASKNDAETPEERPSSSDWIKNSLGLAVTGTAAFLAYSLLTGPDESKVPKIPKTAADDLSPEYVHNKRSLKSPAVYIWGTNEYRVVDPDSKESVVKTPRKMSYFDGQVLRDLKLGETSGAAITENGDLVQWGKGFSETDFKPTKTLAGKNLTSLCMSRDRILALSADGNVYSLPISTRDQSSGRKPQESSWLPFWSGQTARVSYRLIQPSLKLGERVTAISGGLEHVLLLTNTGRVFSAVSSTEDFPKFGQLGIPGLTWATRPQGPVDACHEVKIPNGSKVTQIATGDYHSLLLTKDGDVLAFGDNSFGQLAKPFDPALPFSDTPIPVPFRNLYRGGEWNLRATRIAAGGANSFLTVDAQPVAQDQDPKKTSRVTSDVWTCGRGIWGALGNGKWIHLQDRLTKVKALSGLVEYNEATQNLSPIRLSDISVGTTHVAAVLDNATHLDRTSTSSLDKTTDSGLDVVWWGGNEHFQLGTGKRSNMSKPTHINVPLEALPEDDKELARLQIMPCHRGTVGNRTVNMRQKVECGRHISAIYSAVGN